MKRYEGAERMVMTESTGSAKGWALGLIVLVGTAGCPKEEAPEEAPAAAPTCAEMVQRAVECVPGVSKEQTAELIGVCEGRAERPGHAEELLCSRDASCDGFMTCVDGVRTDFAEARAAYEMAQESDRIGGLLAEENWAEAVSACQELDGDASDAIKALCQQAYEARIQGWMESLEGMRDALEPEDGWNLVCVDLQALAEEVSTERVAPANVLCQEVRLAGRVKRAQEDLKAAVADEPRRVPSVCEYLKVDLGTVESEWARAQAAAFTTTCEEAASGLLERFSALLTSKRDEFATGAEHMNQCSIGDLLADVTSTEEDNTRWNLLCSEVRVARKIGEARQKLDEALEKGDMHRPYHCNETIRALESVESPWATEQLTAFRQLCDQEHPRKVLEATLPKIRAFRDSGESSASRTICYGLNQLVQPLEETERNAAALLCEEAKVASHVEAAMVAGRDAIAQEKTSIPYQCKRALRALEAVESEWSQTQTRQVAETCYQALGVLVLRHRLPTMRFLCDIEVKKVYEAAQKYQLQNEELSVLLTRAEPLCSR